jgi:hypothetical protein
LQQIQDELRESAWQGRAGGFETSLFKQTVPLIADSIHAPTRQRTARSHKITASQTFQLPPLGDIDMVGHIYEGGSGSDNNRGKTAPLISHQHNTSPLKPHTSAHSSLYDVPRKASIDLVDGDIGLMNPHDASEELVRNVLLKVKKKSGIRSLKTSETEKKLFARYNV